MSLYWSQEGGILLLHSYRQKIFCSTLELCVLYWYMHTHGHTAAVALPESVKAQTSWTLFVFFPTNTSVSTKHFTVKKKSHQSCIKPITSGPKCTKSFCWFYYFNKVLYGGQEQGCETLNVCKENHPETRVQFYFLSLSTCCLSFDDSCFCPPFFTHFFSVSSSPLFSC